MFCGVCPHCGSFKQEIYVPAPGTEWEDGETCYACKKYHVCKPPLTALDMIQQAKADMERKRAERSYYEAALKFQEMMKESFDDEG